jgi:hypothetical protein
VPSLIEGDGLTADLPHPLSLSDANTARGRHPAWLPDSRRNLLDAEENTEGVYPRLWSEAIEWYRAHPSFHRITEGPAADSDRYR